MDDKYADCEVCGERFHGSDINAYMVEVSWTEGEWVWVCRHHPEAKLTNERNG